MSDMTMKSIPTSKKNNQMLYNEKEHMPLSYKVSQQKLTRQPDQNFRPI